tara:strand:- start:2181 stop:2423 length:243 start_codon:yes stop_codon:yes gene_type:complete
MTKIKKEQLDKVLEQQTELNQTVNQIGRLEANKHSLLHKLAGINQDIEAVKKELEEEYGSVNINLETGEYTPIEEEKENE